jgi:hypothetical protein
MDKKFFIKQFAELEENIVERLGVRLREELGNDLREFKNMYYNDRDYILSSLKKIEGEFEGYQARLERIEVKVEKHDRKIS